MRQNGDLHVADHIRQGRPTNRPFAESIPRWSAESSVAIGATGVAYCVGVPVGEFGAVITHVRLGVGGTASVTQTAGYVAVRSPAGALLGQSADLGDVELTANTWYDVALATPVLLGDPGLYIVELAIAAATMPTLYGRAVANAAAAGSTSPGTGRPSQEVLAFTHSTGLTAPAAAALPEAGSRTTVAQLAYAVLLG
jgi:hypothetical protein